MSGQPEKIGRYEVRDRVGKGGMGVLYRGLDPVLDREVAIKLMLTDFSEDEEQLRPRFYREARAAARLQHRNIVTIFEFAEEGNTPYIVMEFLRGTSLAERVRTEPPLTLDEKLDIVSQLCTGLHYAHAQGVVHRDVKPANIFILQDGTVKLLDFGIAKVTTSTLTRQGDVLGSASYMSPEQVSGSESVDGRADVFSVGVVLYELLAGRRPFQADAPTAIIMKILHEDPPALASFAPDLPQQLVDAVNKALAKQPADRFANADDLGRALQWIRKALRASGENAILEETRFASTTVIRNLQREQQRQADSKAGTGPAAGETARRPKWLIPAVAAAAVGAIVAVALMSRPSTGERTPASSPPQRSTAAPEPAAIPPPPPSVPAAEAAATPAKTAAVEQASASTSSELRVVSDPAGASITVDGRDTRRVTPATVTVSGGGPHRLRLSKAGFQTTDVRLTESDVAAGSLSYTLGKTEAPTIPVSFTGPYAFAVVDGARTISEASESHELSVAVGKTLRLVAPDYMLNQTVHIDGAPGRRQELQAPSLGKLNVLTKYETCSVRINGRDLGYPPINNQPIAAGTYKIEMVCPNGQNQMGTVIVAPGQSSTARLF